MNRKKSHGKNLRLCFEKALMKKAKRSFHTEPFPPKLAELGLTPEMYNLAGIYFIADKFDGGRCRQRNRQYRKNWGFNYTSLIGLYHTIALFIYPRLVALKELKQGYPAELTVEAWDQILDKMISGFRSIIMYEAASKLPEEKMAQLTEENLDIEEYENIEDETIKLFAQWYGHLWL